MLAVIEHLDFPRRVIEECFRILNENGILVITTPKAKGEWLMKIYSPNYEREEGEHKAYFEYAFINIIDLGIKEAKQKIMAQTSFPVLADT